MEVIHRVSALTHGHPRSQMACGIYTMILWELMDSRDKSAVKSGLSAAKAYYENREEYQQEWKHFSRLFAPDFSDTPEEEISSSGYVVSTLEAALWCLLNTDSYSDCILKAVNLGDDTDTVAAVAGGLAGAIYGTDGIPAEWIEGLRKKEDLLGICERFCNT